MYSSDGRYKFANKRVSFARSSWQISPRNSIKIFLLTVGSTLMTTI